MAGRLEVWERVRCMPKNKIYSYIPASVPGPSLLNMSATVPKKQMKKAGQHTEGQESDKQKRNTLTFSDKIKIINHM